MIHSTASRLGLRLLLCFGSASFAAAQSPNCQPNWVQTFGHATGPGLALRGCAFDDGSGPALYVAGYFLGAAWSPGGILARWDGQSWSFLGHPPDFDFSMSISLEALCVHDDGSGPALYLGGRFGSESGAPLHGLVRWNGSLWSAMPSTLGSYGWVHSLLEYDDGSGLALYAGGTFTIAGVTSDGVARWDGTSWTALGSGFGGSVPSPRGARALAVFDDGSGPALYAGGSFSTAGGLAASGIARWDGQSWSAVGGGLGGNSPLAHDLCVFDDGGGPALYAAGEFTQAGGVAANHIARWNGLTWSPVGGGLPGQIHTLAIFDAGSGPQLHAGGRYIPTPGLYVAHVGRWNGASWETDEQMFGGAVEDLVAFDDGTGRTLHALGSFTRTASWSSLPGVARRVAGSWMALGSGLDGAVTALATFDDGSGPALYAGGPLVARPTQLGGVGRWKGGRWSALDGGLRLGSEPGTALALCVHDDGTGAALYAGGSFDQAGTVPARSIARWNGAGWQALGTGVEGHVDALASHDDGSGPALFVGGDFGALAPAPQRYLRRWDGAAWQSVGGGVSGEVRALVVWDDGSGPVLIAGGDFTSAGGVPASHVASWDGTSWSPLAGGITIGNPASVYALAVHDEGSGRALFAGGPFTQASGIVARSIARWDGASWSTLGTGLRFAAGGTSHVGALVEFDTGSGPALYAAGGFDTAGSSTARGIARWQNGQWSAVGAGLSEPGAALAVHDEGQGPALFVGGEFEICLNSGDSFLAKWGQPAGCGWSGAVVCEPGVGGVLACPCANPPASAARGCDNAAGSGGARLEAHGHSSLSNDALVFTASGEPATATSLVLQGDALLASGASFGQGVRCLGGALKRLYVKSALAGSITAPAAGDASVSARSAMLGDAIVAGTRRYYGVHYRAAQVLGGCPATSTFNVTQQLDVLWQP